MVFSGNSTVPVGTAAAASFPAFRLVAVHPRHLAVTVCVGTITPSRSSMRFHTRVWFSRLQIIPRSIDRVGGISELGFWTRFSSSATSVVNWCISRADMLGIDCGSVVEFVAVVSELGLLSLLWLSIHPNLMLSPPLSTSSIREGGGVNRGLLEAGDFDFAVFAALDAFEAAVDCFFAVVAAFGDVRRRFLPAAAVVFSAGMLYLAFAFVFEKS